MVLLHREQDVRVMGTTEFELLWGHCSTKWWMNMSASKRQDVPAAKKDYVLHKSAIKTSFSSAGRDLHQLAC